MASGAEIRLRTLRLRGEAGCCARDCGCCFRLRRTHREPLLYSHCTQECGCCIRHRGYYRADEDDVEDKGEDEDDERIKVKMKMMN